MGCPRLKDRIEGRLHFFQSMRSTVPRASGVEVKERHLGVLGPHCLENFIGSRPVARHDQTFQEPSRLFVPSMAGDGSEVDGACPSALLVQLDAKNRSMKRRGVGRKLDATSTCTIEHDAIRQAVLGHRLGPQGCDLPRRCERLSFVGMKKHKTPWGRSVLCKFHETL